MINFKALRVAPPREGRLLQGVRGIYPSRGSYNYWDYWSSCCNDITFCHFKLPRKSNYD